MRIIRNSFISGEISPELHGRHDLEAYFQGAERLSNFVVRRTGGVRKRPGTSLLLHVSHPSATAFRAVPFLHDRTHFCVLVLMIDPASHSLRWVLHKRGPNIAGTSPVGTTDVSQFASDEDLAALRFKQYGDTLVFTAPGRRSFEARIWYDTMQVEFNEILDSTPVAPAPNVSVVSAGFGSGDDYIPDVRRYALYGVRGGVYGEPSIVQAKITLLWKAGATVTLRFSPQWHRHDYYILAKHRGATYGHIASFFPNLQAGEMDDCNWANQNVDASATFSDITYDAQSSSINSTWTGDPNGMQTATEGEVHKTAAFATPGGLSGTYKSMTSPILAVKIWFGAKVVNKTTNQAEAVGNPGMTTVTLSDVNGTVIDTWTVSALYGESAQTLVVQNPAAGISNQYVVKLENADNDHVLVRGVMLISDFATQTYVDNNIEPGDITGQQELLIVGDSGMDCANSEMWEQRLLFASSKNLPFSMWFSAVGDLRNFHATRPQTPSDAFSVTIPPSSASRLLHLKSTRWLLAFTESAEYIIDSAGDGGMSYQTVRIQRCSSVGAHDKIEPVDAEKNLLFVAQDARSVYELRYDLSQDSVVPIDRSILANHLTERARIVKIAYQRFPDSVLWCLMSDGTLASMTYMPDQKVIAWARHRIGMRDGCKQELVDIMSTGSIYDADGSEATSDIILVFRSPESPSDIWIERMNAHGTGDAPVARRDHEGYDEADYPGGEPAECAIEAEMTILRPETPDTNTIGMQKSVFDTVVRVRRSGKIAVRPDDEEVVLNASAPSLGLGEPLYTGDIKVLPNSVWNADGRMVIASADENPCEIQCVVFNMETEVEER